MDFMGAFLIGLASGMIGAISTGGGLISIPGLIFLGVSPVSAIATTRLSAISGGLSSLYKYHKSGSVLWRYIPYFILIAIVTGIIGPKLLLEINEEFLERAIGILMLVMLPVLIFKKEFGTISKHKSRNYKLTGLIAVFMVMIYGTMFGAGGGIFLIYSLIYFFGMTVTQANATGTVVWLIGTSVALVTYIASGAVIFSVGVPLLLGAIIGGYIGAQQALKRGTAWVRWVLVTVIIASSVKLIFF